MRISSFYGISLPVLLFALEHHGIVTDSAVDNIIKYTPRKENYGLYLGLSDCIGYLQLLGSGVRYKHVENPALNSMGNLHYEFVAECLTFLYQKELEGNRFSIELSELEQVVKETTASLSKPSVRAFRRELKGLNERGEVIKAGILESFIDKSSPLVTEVLVEQLQASGNKFDFVLPDEINGLTLTDLDKKMITFYLNSLRKHILCLIQEGEMRELSTELLNYNPNSIYYTVHNKFEILDDKKGTLVTVQSAVESMQELIQQSIKIVSTDASAPMDFNKVTMRNQTLTDEFTSFCRQNKIALNSANQDAIKTIILVSYVFNADNLNSKFVDGTRMTEQEWVAQFERMDRMGICGANFDTQYLAVRELDNIYIAMDNKVSKENKPKFMMVLNDVKAFLDCFMPIGTAI